MRKPLPSSHATLGEPLDEVQPSPPSEPGAGEIYIDRGAALPERYPGTMFRALIRDPGTIFIYWDIAADAPLGWEICAWSTSGELLQAIRVPPGSGRAYLYLAAALVSQVTLRALGPDEQHEFAALLEQAQPAAIAALPDDVERWGRVEASGHVTMHPETDEPQSASPAPTFITLTLAPPVSPERSWTDPNTPGAHPGLSSSEQHYYVPSSQQHYRANPRDPNSRGDA